MDFTVDIYKELLKSLKASGYSFQTFEDYLIEPKPRVVVLRHDVDRRAANAVQIAKVEISEDVKASYYFRIVPESNDSKVIKEIVKMGHEIGYHYEDLGIAKGDYSLAYREYLKNLSYFRNYYPVSTICMHGSPLSNIDNRDIWNKYDYKKEGIIGEPYFDIDFTEFLYVTDTGRGWNKKNVIVRDKVETNFNFPINDTISFIELINKKMLPDKLMINTHPQRWFNFGILWVNELIIQNIKNIVKRNLIKYRAKQNI